MKLSKAIEGYVAVKTADNYSTQTIGSYLWALKHLCAYLQDPELESITEEQLRQFVIYMRSEYKPMRMSGNDAPLSQTSLDKIWVSFRSFWNWAAPELGLATRPDRGMRRPKFTLKAVSGFTEDEVRRLLKAALFTKPVEYPGRKSFQKRRHTALRDVAIILFLLDTGVRVSEMCRLRIHEINLGTGEVLIANFGSGTKSRSRYVYLGKASRKAVWRYLASRDAEPSDLAFVTDEGKPLDKDTVRKVLVHIGELAGVSGVHPHRFRHSAAIEFLRNGGDVFTLQRLLGHQSLSMVSRYLNLVREDLAAAHKTASPVDRWSL